MLKEPAYEVVELNLSKNMIQDLRGIEQFPNLRKLDLSYNQIHDIHNVFYLKTLSKLENLNLAVNGISQQSNYKETILCMIPTLKFLDLRAVKREDFESINPNLRKQYALLEILLHNYCELIKLQSVVKKLDMHKELMQQDKRFLLTHASFDIKKFRTMYPYAEGLDERVKNDFRIDLLRDIKIIEESLLRKSDIDKAAHELITRQQGKINELTKMIDKKAKVLDTVKQQNAGRFAKEEREKDVIIVSSPRADISANLETSRISKGFQASMDRTSFFRGSKKEVETRESLNTSTKSIPTVRRVHKTEAEKLIHPTGRKSASPERSQSPERDVSPIGQSPKVSADDKFLKSTRSVSPQSIRSEYWKTKKLDETAPGASVQETQQSIGRDQTPVRDSVASYKSSPANRQTSQNIGEKDKQIENLSRTLKKKIEEVLRAEDLNRDLAQKMRKLQEDSDLTTKIAREEYNNLQREFERTENLKNSLAEEITELQEELDRLKSRANQLELENRALREDSQKAKIYAQELAMLNTIEEKMEIAERFSSEKIIIKVFKLLRLAVLKSQTISQLKNRNAAKRNKKLIELVFRTIQRKTILSKIIKMKQLERTKNLCADTLWTWRLNVRFSKRYRSFVGERRDVALFKSFKIWKKYTSLREEKKRYQAKFVHYHNQFILKAAFNAFKKNYRQYNYPAIELKKKEREAANYNKQRQKRFFFAVWRHCVYHILTPTRLKGERAASLYIKNLLAMGLRLFKANYLLYKRAEAKADYMFKTKQKRLVAAHFDAWKDDFHSYAIFKDKLVTLQNKYIQNRRWNQWREAYKTSQYFKILTLSADAHFHKHLKQTVFNALLKNHEIRNRRRELLAAYEAHRENNERREAWAIWRQAFAIKREKFRKAEEARLRTLRNLFDAWLERNQQSLKKKGKMNRAINQHKKIVSNLRNNIFYFWKQRSSYLKRLALVERTIEERQRFSICRVYFNALAGELRQKLRRNIAELVEERDEALNKAQENLEYGNKADEERLDLMDKLEVLSKTCSDLQYENSRQSEQIAALTAELEQRRLQDEKVASELRMKEDALRKLSLNDEESKKMVQNRDQELEKLMHEQRAHRQELQAQIETLRTENENKQRIIDEIEQGLDRQADEYHQYYRNSEDKLNQLSIEGSDLRHELQRKDSELQEVLHALDGYMKKNEELKAQLKSSLDSMVDASSKYENKFNELHQRNMQMEIENEELKKRNKQFQSDLIELRGLLKKYEYEVEMMSVKQQPHSETDQFIKDLHRAKEKASNIQRKYQEEERTYRLESSQSLSRLEMRRGTATSPSLERERKTATLEKPIQELKTYLVSAENDRDIRKTRLGQGSPSYAHASRTDLHAPREAYTYRERKYSPKAEIYPIEKPKTSRISPKRVEKEIAKPSPKPTEKESIRSSPRRPTEKDTSLSMNKTVESIQQEIEKFKVFKSQIKDNMAQRNKALKQKIFS